MSERSAYLDTSAFMKTITLEPESGALMDFLRAWPSQVGSVLLRTEAVRAARGSAAAPEVRSALSEIDLIAFTDQIFDDAGTLDPPRLRSLDAIHLAAARALGDDLGVFVTYDSRLAEAANALGLPTAAPGSRKR